MKDTIISVVSIAVGVVIGLVAYALFFPNHSLGAITASTAGVTNSTAKVAQQSITTATTTTFAVLNTDATDREITSADIQIANQNSTTTTFTVNCATSTTASSLNSNANYIFSTALSNTVYGTTTGAGLYMASSSPGLTGTSTASATVPGTVNQYVRNWTTGTYLVCQVTTVDGYNAFTSGATGFLAFPYRVQ